MNTADIQETAFQRKAYSARLFPWIVWTLAASFFFYKYLLQISPSVITTELMQAYSITGAELGHLAACFFYAYLIMQIPVGIILDRYSPKIITTLAILICSIGACIFSYANTLLVAEFSRALIGLGSSFAAVACFKLISVWFPANKFSLLAGLSMTAAMLGAIGGQVPLSYLVTQYGWRQAMLYVALPGFILALIFFSVVRDKKSHVPIIERCATDSNTFKHIFKSKQTWVLCLYSGLAFTPISVFGGLWGGVFLEQAYHYNKIEAASALSFIFIGFAMGCPLAGWLSTYLENRKRIILYGTITAAITLTTVLYVPFHSRAFISTLLFCFGLGASCFFLCFSMLRESYPTALAATALGFMNTFDSVCEAFSEPFIGKLLDLSWNGPVHNGIRFFSVHDYRVALLSLPIYFVIALILLYFIQETYPKPHK